MGKLHELLAVETDLGGKAQTTLKVVKGLFGARESFLGKSLIFTAYAEDGPSVPDEITKVSHRVQDSLDLVTKHWGNWVDASIQKEVTNQQTSATIELDGVNVPQLPATALLNLENKLALLRNTLNAVPVNDTLTDWTWDEESLMWLSDPRYRQRTQKVRKSHVLHPGTAEHAPQVESYTEDVPVGEVETIIYSGMLQPSELRQVLDRLDTLILAVKRARQRANDIETENVQVAAKLLEYVFKE
jgi:hypothetical protein